ncbi:MAG: serine--tRNA ligase, partial [Planctomycetes bacterium]|nr:serine--tRNA ligase [Planctomycetota bacterium]
MLDIKIIRDMPEVVKRGLKLKRANPALVDDILGADERLRAIKTEIESLRAEQNAKSKDFGRIKREGGDLTALQAEVNTLKERISELDGQLNDAEDVMQERMDIIPNLPHSDVPEGDDAAGNICVFEWGTPVKQPTPVPHWEIAERYGFLQETGAKISGSGFLLSVGPLARLERALVNLFLDTHTKQNGYQEASIPFVVRENALYGTGYLPKLAG